MDDCLHTEARSAIFPESLKLEITDKLLITNHN